MSLLAAVLAQSLGASAAGDPTAPAALLAALDDVHDGPVVGMSFDRELLSDVRGAEGLAGRAIELKVAGWDPAGESVPDGTCGLWFARDKDAYRMVTIGSCPAIAAPAAALVPAAPAEPRSDASLPDRGRAYYRHSLLLGPSFQRLGNGRYQGLSLAWRGARWRSTHLGVDLAQLWGAPGVAVGGRLSWALAPLTEHLGGPWVGPSLVLRSGAMQKDDDGERWVQSTTVGPGYVVGWRIPWHPGFTFEAALAGDLALPLSGPPLERSGSLGGTVALGWSLGQGPPPEADADARRRAAIGVGVAAGGVVLVGLVVLGLYAAAMSNLPIGG